MHHLDPGQLKAIFGQTKRSKTFFNKTFESFVESGTHLGHTISRLHNHFKKLYTVEISEHYYNICKNEFKSFNNVELVLGDSLKVFPEFIKKIDSNAIFWLDGHWSCGNTGKGDIEVPLLEEIKIIDSFKKKAALIIDDVRLFGSKNDVDWSKINEKNIVSCLNDNRVEDYYYYGDRFVILYNSVE
jgi:hypothetical protein